MSITKQWLQHQISAIETVGITDSNTLEAFKMALAGMEAEPVAYMWDSDRKDVDAAGFYRPEHKIFAESSVKQYGGKVLALYAAPQPLTTSERAELENYRNAQQVVPDIRPDWQENEFSAGWNACRAAMLQGAEPVTTAYKLRDAVEATRNSGIEIDAEKILAERDALNAPDCWCRTCQPITLTDMRFVVCPNCGNKRCPHANDHRNACTGSNEPGQEGSAYPAAPQQEE